MKTSSNWTGKTARDMEQAFGPHIRSSHGIEPMPEPMHPADIAVIVASIISVIALAVIFALELL